MFVDDDDDDQSNSAVDSEAVAASAAAPLLLLILLQYITRLTIGLDPARRSTTAAVCQYLPLTRLRTNPSTDRSGGQMDGWMEPIVYRSGVAEEHTVHEIPERAFANLSCLSYFVRCEAFLLNSPIFKNKLSCSY